MNQTSRKRTADEAAVQPQQDVDAGRPELEVITGQLWQPSCQALAPIPKK
ncbi:hypothetical protein TSOC_015390, partial [Tetrabaena socialis]